MQTDPWLSLDTSLILFEIIPRTWTMFKLSYLRLWLLFLPNCSLLKLLSGERRVTFRVYLTHARVGHEMREYYLGSSTCLFTATEPDNNFWFARIILSSTIIILYPMLMIGAIICNLAQYDSLKKHISHNLSARCCRCFHITLNRRSVASSTFYFLLVNRFFYSSG